MLFRHAVLTNQMNLSSCAMRRTRGESHESDMAWGRCDQQQKVSVMEVGLITSELLKHHVGQASGKGGGEQCDQEQIWCLHKRVSRFVRKINIMSGRRRGRRGKGQSRIRRLSYDNVIGHGTKATKERSIIFTHHLGTLRGGEAGRVPSVFSQVCPHWGSELQCNLDSS